MAEKTDEQFGGKTPKRIEVHVIIGCSDARDIPQTFFDTLKELKLARWDNGRAHIDVERLSVAGTFVTEGIIAEVKTLILNKVTQYFEYDKKGVPLDFYVHVNAHGDATLKEGAKRENHSIQDIQVSEGSKFNCGMMGAHVVAREIEALLLKEKPTLQVGSSVRGKIKIRSEDDIRDLLKMAYNFRDGSIIEWIQPIHDLPGHARDQKNKLRAAFDRDPEISHLGVHITAGVQNYRTNDYIRVDGNTEFRRADGTRVKSTFFDDVYAELRKRGNGTENEVRVGNHEPKLGLFHMSSIQDARKKAAEHVLGADYAAGQVFAIGSAYLDRHRRPMEQYQVGGAHYGITHLHLDRWPVLCENEKQTERALSRLDNDPLVGFFMKHYDVKKIPLDLKAMELADNRQSFPHRNGNGGQRQIMQAKKH